MSKNCKKSYLQNILLINSCEHAHFNKEINDENSHDDEDGGERNASNNRTALQICVSDYQRFLSSMSSSSSNNHNINLILLHDENN